MEWPRVCSVAVTLLVSTEERLPRAVGATWPLWPSSCPSFRRASPVEMTVVGMAVTPCRGGGDVTAPAVMSRCPHDDSAMTSR